MWNRHSCSLFTSSYTDSIHSRKRDVLLLEAVASLSKIKKTLFYNSSCISGQKQVMDCGLNQGKNKIPEYTVVCGNEQHDDGSLAF